MQSPIPEARAADAAWLSAQIAEFERRGGSVEPIGTRIGNPLKPDFNNHKRGIRQEVIRTPKELADKHCRKGAKGRQAYIASCKAERDQVAPMVLSMSKEGKTVEQIAAAAGISVGTVSKIRVENGVASPRGVGS